MKKWISLLSLVSLFSLAIACNQNDRQDEEVRGMETTDERMEQTDNIERTDDLEGTDQRMEDSTFQDNRDELNEDNMGTEERVEEGVTP